MRLEPQTAAVTGLGGRRFNEDAFGIWRLPHGELCVAVADGVGGQAGGALASKLTIDMLGNALNEGRKHEILTVVHEIHAEILRRQFDSVEFREMSTTLSVGLFDDEGLYAVHCGDTRIVAQRGAGIMRLTEDHTEAQRLFSKGALTREQFRAYPRKNIIENAIGVSGSLRIDEFEFKIEKGDNIFFSSDGFHDKVFLQELRLIALEQRTPERIVAVAEEELLRRGAEDNYTLICCSIR